ncbi:MAG: tetratricopeptide repeat protein [Anaerolineales bacterium]|nr:MAG: tetratricopeptide repeat protein [Anaerolineales bacterium]
MIFGWRFGKIHPVRVLRIVIIMIAVVLLGLLLYQIPSVQSRLDWGFTQISTYLRGVINPIGVMPTSIGVSSHSGSVTPSATASPPPPTPSEPTAAPLPSPTPLPPSVYLQPPDLIIQEQNNCGPASLAMYLSFYGWDLSFYDWIEDQGLEKQAFIASIIRPVTGDRNVNVEELDLFTRENVGWLNTQYRVGGDIELLKTFIANGIPVMIEEGDALAQQYWPGDDMWAGHFLLITGYDDAAQSFYAQDSFRQQDRQVTYADTDSRWRYFNRVYILIYHPNQEETVKQILGSHWDLDYNRQHALDIAQAETDADPRDALAWFNLGTNLVYFERYDEAARAYDEAREIGLPQRMLRYQFGPFHAYFHSLRTEDLLALIEYALTITPNSEEAWLWRGWVLWRLGDNAGAIKAFRRSYKENPNSFFAQNALDFMGVTP